VFILLRKYSEKRKQEDHEETDGDVVLQTAVEAEDLWEEELNSFKPASRTTGSAFCWCRLQSALHTCNTRMVYCVPVLQQ